MNKQTYSVCRDFLEFVLHHLVLVFYLFVHDKLQKCGLVFIKTFVDHVLWYNTQEEEEEEESWFKEKGGRECY